MFRASNDRGPKCLLYISCISLPDTMGQYGGGAYVHAYQGKILENVYTVLIAA